MRWVLFVLVVLLGSALQASAREVSFNRDIRPILSDRCYFCHGFDANHREGDLRLDLAESARGALAPGDPEGSEVLRRITSRDRHEVMPPPEAHKKPISPVEAELIRKWIEAGAEYEPHWAFVAPVRPRIEATRTREAIDHFVAQGHAAHGLAFAQPALPSRWLRRVSLDLTGVPPTTEQMEAFERAASELGDAAYEAAVDRLLATPRYGERMALEWLDVARYADTNGFQSDAYRMNWPWRDWVARSFNANMPFDRFTIEQLAGDLLTDGPGGAPTQDQLIATAFNRNHMINGEGGAIQEENLAKNNFDRVETTATAWLGLTVGCCQCHDHKFDPLKQRDYYSLMSLFNQISETGTASKRFSAKRNGRPIVEAFWVDRPYLSLASPQQQEAMAALKKQTQRAQKRLDAARPEFEPALVKWVQEMRDDPSLQVVRVPEDTTRRFITTAALDNPKDNGTRKLTDYFVARHEPWATMKKAVEEAASAEAELQIEIPLVMVMRDDQPRETFVMLRGNYETLGDRVSPAVPDFLPPLPEQSEGARPNRLNFARWLTAAENPLTARVTVNRYWQLVFGRGLVGTPDDFGLQGALPTHPELLDWLAVEFRESGWDVKALLKGMVLSRAYRQTAAVDADRVSIDPANEWLARGPRYRLDSRLLRDQALALSGLLVEEVGGPPVAPYQPPGIWEAMSLNKNHYAQDHGDALYRRSLYTVWRRVVAPANFFDAPSRQSCAVSPKRTNTPLHALTTLNDVTYVEAARVWAERTLEVSGDDSRLAELFFAATGRRADPRELESLERSLAGSREHFAGHPEAASQLIGAGEAPRAVGLPEVEHAAWTDVCLLVLNLDEALCN